MNRAPTTADELATLQRAIAKHRQARLACQVFGAVPHDAITSGMRSLKAVADTKRPRQRMTAEAVDEGPLGVGGSGPGARDQSKK